MSYTQGMSAKDTKITVRIAKNDWLKLAYLNRHDDTNGIGDQIRKAIKTYLNNRKKTVYPAMPENLSGGGESPKVGP